LTYPFDKRTLKMLQQHAQTIADATEQLQMPSRYRPPAAEVARMAQAFEAIKPVAAYLRAFAPYLEREPDEHEVLNVNEESDLIVPDAKLRIAQFSPSIPLLDKLLQGTIDLDALHWREFEELVADLLSKDGYHVELGPGRKDGGKDIVAVKEVEGVGLFMAVWQAKKLSTGKKVGIGVIRELADTCHEQKASKGIIVTTTTLTSVAIQRIQRDRYILGKVDRDDLLEWIRRIRRR
jgi:restriction endonuclease Mrr